MSNGSRIVAWYLAIIKGAVLLGVFLPLLILNDFIFPFVFPRTVVFRMLVEIGIVAYVGLILIKPHYRPSWSIIPALFAAFVGIVAVTAAIGVNPYRSTFSSVERGEGVVTLLHLAGYFLLVVATSRTRDDWVKLLRVASLAGWVQVAYSLGQLLNASFAIKAAGERIHGTIGNPAFFASYLIFIIGLSLWLYFNDPSKRWHITHLVLCVISLYLLWGTQTRGALVGLGFGVIVFAFLAISKTVSPRFAIASLFAGIALLTLAFMTIRDNIPVIRESRTLSRIANVSFEDVSTQNRFIVWGVGARAILERPIFGWGWENFSVPFNTFFDPRITRDIGSNPWYDRAHNILIEVAVGSGIIGLVVYLLIMSGALLVLIRPSNSAREVGDAIIASTLVAYCTQNLFVFDTVNSYIMLVLVLALASARHKDFAAMVERGAPPLFKSGSHVAAMALPILACLTALYYLNVQPALANSAVLQAVTGYNDNPAGGLRQFERAFRHSNPRDEEYRFYLAQYTRDQVNRRGATADTEPLITFAIAELERTRALAPDTTQTHLLLSEVYLASTNLEPTYLERAEAVALDALARAPRRYQVYTLLGRIKMSQGKPNEGIEYFRQAIVLNNSFAETYWNLGIAYLLSHQYDEANKTFARAESLGFDIYEDKNIERLFAAYRDAQDPFAMRDFLEDLTEKSPGNTKYAEALAAIESIISRLPSD